MPDNTNRANIVEKVRDGALLEYRFEGSFDTREKPRPKPVFAVDARWMTRMQRKLQAPDEVPALVNLVRFQQKETLKNSAYVWPDGMDDSCLLAEATLVDQVASQSWAGGSTDEEKLRKLLKSSGHYDNGKHGVNTLIYRSDGTAFLAVSKNSRSQDIAILKSEGGHAYFVDAHQIFHTVVGSFKAWVFRNCVPNLQTFKSSPKHTPQTKQPTPEWAALLSSSLNKQPLRFPSVSELMKETARVRQQRNTCWDKFSAAEKFNFVIDSIVGWFEEDTTIRVSHNAIDIQRLQRPQEGQTPVPKKNTLWFGRFGNEQCSWIRCSYKFDFPEDSHDSCDMICTCVGKRLSPMDGQFEASDPKKLAARLHDIMFHPDLATYTHIHIFCLFLSCVSGCE